MCGPGSVFGIRTRIHKAPESGSRTLVPFEGLATIIRSYSAKTLGVLSTEMPEIVHFGDIKSHEELHRKTKTLLLRLAETYLFKYKDLLLISLACFFISLVYIYIQFRSGRELQPCHYTLLI